ncbi:MAG TPA: hypothetical protein VFB34_13180 [Chloroflexota bacterium]|nr:hypothetical protein [Chloroflexota bacterium]
MSADAYQRIASRALDAISDSELRVGIGRLFEIAQEEVNRGATNLVILTARRLACLYQLLTQQGMPELSGCDVVSDRYLDANPSRDWADARVLLLDDSVVVGTTLVRLHDELASRIKDPSAIRCRSVCLDKEQKADFLIEGLDFKALYERSAEEVRRFSTESVIALFRNQVPFFSDFPVTRPIQLTEDAWISWLANFDWHVADVTAPLLDDHRCQALAHIPTSSAFEALLSRVVPEASELVDTFKIRSYARQSEEELAVVLVPIAMLAPCTPSILDRALEAIATSIRGDQPRLGIGWQEWEPVAKHRLIQIYISTCVLADVWSSLAETAGLGKLSVESLDSLPAALYFGEAAKGLTQAFEAVIEQFSSTPVGAHTRPIRVQLDEPQPSPLLREDRIQEVLWEQRELLAMTGMPEEPNRGELTKVGLIFAHAVSSIYGFINREYEEPQRVEIKTLPSRAEYDQRFSDPNRRYLAQGFTMRELTSALAPTSATGSPWARSLVSLAIDVGNDLGIIVPVTQHDRVRDVVFRAYRLGETAHLSDSPLTRAATNLEFDMFARAVEHGYPIFTTKGPIGQETLFSAGIASTVDALRLAILEAIPGRVEYRFQGTILRVEDDVFAAELISPLGEDHRVARMKLDQVPDADRGHLAPGAPVIWSVFVREHGGARDRISRVRIPAPVPFDAEELGRSVEALSYLSSSSSADDGTPRG